MNNVRSPDTFSEGKNSCLAKLRETYDPHTKYGEIIASGLRKKICMTQWMRR